MGGIAVPTMTIDRDDNQAIEPAPTAMTAALILVPSGNAARMALRDPDL